MAESTEMQALAKISTEVGESQIKITFSSQCIKAQAFLVNKLKKQTERQKEICSIVSNINFKLQTEIKQAELEIKSLIAAHETIKSGNTELKKELLLAKDKKAEIAERISKGEKKYEALWLESKERYESIPFVQNLIQARSETQILKDNIVTHENKSHLLIKELQKKKDFFANLDKHRIIELAEYIVNFMPDTTKAIQEKSTAINEISKEIDNIAQNKEHIAKKQSNTNIKQMENNCDEIKNIKSSYDAWLNISAYSDHDVMTVPRLQFMNSDFDALNAKLDQIKVMKIDSFAIDSPKTSNAVENITDFSNKRMRNDEFSIFLNNHTSSEHTMEKEHKTDAYSKRKLIHILEDVQLDKNDAYNMVSTVDLGKLKGVNMIGKDITAKKENCALSDNKENETIEEIDLTKPDENNSNLLLIPPKQFLDLSQDKRFSKAQQVEVIVHMSMTEQSSENMTQSLKNSQENMNKKRVSFDLPLSIQEMTSENNEDEIEKNKTDSREADETVDSQLDLSSASDESFSKIKNMILKKHKLDLSPQFTYTKAKMMQMNTDEKIITSKFFQPEMTEIVSEAGEDNNNKFINSAKDKEEKLPNAVATESINEANAEAMDLDQAVISSPKPSQKTERGVTGFLFNHGTQGIPESLNVSISTTGFEDGDTDFPQCIDSSLLLSPKADLPMPTNDDNPDVTSQEIPSFLSGLRKTGLSFFGQSATTDSKLDASGPNPINSFKFNFGGGEQKRGGLFSLFN